MESTAQLSDEDESEEDQGPLRRRRQVLSSSDDEEVKDGEEEDEGDEDEEDENDDEEEEEAQQQDEADGDELFFWGDPRDGIKVKRRDLYRGPGECRFLSKKWPIETKRGRYARPKKGTSGVRTHKCWPCLQPAHLATRLNQLYACVPARSGI
jgi:hypothetical protein